MVVTLRQLEVFVQIARQGNLTRAAQQIFLTQSAASMSLGELERALGGPLFYRVGRGLVLNDRGRLLLPYAEAALTSVAEMIDLGQDTGETPAGNLIVGCSTTIGNYFFPRHLKSFVDSNPGIEITLRVGNTQEIADLVKNGIVDIGLIEGDLQVRGLKEEDWLRDELVVFAAPDHRLVKIRPVHPEDLVNEQWIMREKGSGTLTTIEQVLARENLRLTNVHEIGHTEAIKRAVEVGMGISCLSRMAVEQELAAGNLVQIVTRLDIHRWFRIITLEGQYQGRLIHYVLDWLRGLGTEESSPFP